MPDGILSNSKLSIARLDTLLKVWKAGSVVAAVRHIRNKEQRHAAYVKYREQIRELEQAFNISIIEHDGDETRFTAEGKRLISVAGEFLGSIEDLSDTFAHKRFLLRLAAGDSLIHWLILPRIGTLRSKIPGMHLALRDMSRTMVTETLTEMGVDFGVVRSVGSLPVGIEGEPLGSLEFRLFVPNGLYQHHAQKRPLQLLKQLPLALQDNAVSFSGSADNDFIRVLADCRITISTTLCCEGFPQVCKAVKSGEYAAILPVLAAQELPPDGFRQIEIPEVTSKLDRDLALVFHTRRREILGSRFEDVMIALKETLNVGGR